MNVVTASTPAPAALKPAPVVVPAKKRKSKIKWYIIGGVVLVVGLGVAAKMSDKGKAQATLVTVDKAFIKTITQVVTATGKVQPEVEVKISPEVAGEIIALPVKDGNVVKKGDLLVKIKPDFYQAQYEQEEANLAGAKTVAIENQAQLQKASDDFKRAEDLYAKNLISDSDFAAARTTLDVAKATHENALAQIRRTEGSLNQARDLVEKTTIYAPMDGTISSLTSEAGERVVAQSQFTGTEIMRIADLSNMELRVKVNENDIVNVKIGDHATITIDAFPGRKFSGTVYEISSSAITTGAQAAGSNQALTTDEVANFLVKIRVADRDVTLRPGMSGVADIETQTAKDVVAIPVQSVTVRAGNKTTEDLQKQKAKDAREKSGNELDVASEREEARRNRDKLDHVVFIKKGGVVEQRKVETGIADNTSIEVKSGVKAGEEVVSGSYAAISRKLKNGSKVALERPKKDEDKK